MVTLDGVEISTAVPQVRIVDIVIGQPVLEVVAPAKALIAGSRFVRRRYSTREVVVTLDLSIQDVTTREAARKALLAWCDHDTPVWLQLDAVTGKHLVVTCSSLPEFSIGQWWLSDLQIKFTALDPYFIDDAAHTANVGAAFTVGGQGPALTTIQQTLSAGLTAPAWSLDAGESVFLTGSFNAGDVLKLDMEARCVELNNDPSMDRVLRSSRFFELAPGAHTVAGANGAAGTVSWFERYL